MDTKDLGKFIDNFDTLILELDYYLKSNRSFIEVELSDNYNNKREFFNLIDGIEFSNQSLLERFKVASNELTEIKKALKNENS